MKAIVMATFLTGAIVGGVAGATASDLMRAPVVAIATPTATLTAAPSLGFTPVSVTTSNDVSATVAAVNAVLPAVVTVINRGNSGVEAGSGSGVIVDKDLGYIVTNSHVVEMTRSTQPASVVDVILSNGTRKSATVVGNDPSTDIAVLRVAGGGLPAQAALGDPADVPLGAQVIAIGSPGISTGFRGGGAVLENTVTSGIVSGKGRSFPRADLRGNVTLRDLVQTDA
ncbi:MAG: trypsin-like peptidase domain-containing protein, partial [Chloroflexi bacterium]|nr:trypsin-like peptidase domain-containing protein [Chloroflexota bacterium]